MIDHISLQVDDVEAALEWYTAIFLPLGVGALVDFGDVIGFGPDDAKPSFWINKATDPDGRQTHIAFVAENRQAVDEVHRVAVRLGREILNAPREWPEYHPGYYAVFVRDPDGNNIEAVCHRPVE
ncbi:MAG TPA: VOC family protein [Jatrophihabitans sp.]|jgi:catechol 2,3-dioxygenase-like lactoylglutathione lyase family enzyme